MFCRSPRLPPFCPGESYFNEEILAIRVCEWSTDFEKEREMYVCLDVREYESVTHVTHMMNAFGYHGVIFP